MPSITKQLVLLACLFHPQGIRAQSQAEGVSPFARVSGAFFGVSVSDLNASERWYSEKLGLRVAMRTPSNDRMQVVVLQGGGLTVELVHDAGARPASAGGGGNPTATHGIFKAGVVVGDLQAALSVLESRGVAVAFGPYLATATQKANAIIRDNAGNLIQLFGS